jgi:hypothetical protein
VRASLSKTAAALDGKERETTGEGSDAEDAQWSDLLPELSFSVQFFKQL